MSDKKSEKVKRIEFLPYLSSSPGQRTRRKIQKGINLYSGTNDLMHVCKFKTTPQVRGEIDLVDLGWK